MSRTVCNSLIVIASIALLAGCGLTQSISEATTSTTKSIFYTEVKTLHLDFSGRASVNMRELNMAALSVPTMVRVYQLRSEKAVERADYDKLVSNDEDVLVGDLLDRRALVIRPEQGAQLNAPLHEDARFVAVVALFRQSEGKADSWRLTLKREDLDPDQARVVELGNNQLTLRPLVKD